MDHGGGRQYPLGIVSPGSWTARGIRCLCPIEAGSAARIGPSYSVGYKAQVIRLVVSMARY